MTRYPGRRVRLTWKPQDWPEPSTLQITVIPTGDNAIIAFHQEKLTCAEDRKRMRARWQAALDRLQPLLEDCNDTGTERLPPRPSLRHTQGMLNS